MIARVQTGEMGLSFSNWAGTYVECPLHGRNLFREQDDIEGIHLRLHRQHVALASQASKAGVTARAYRGLSFFDWAARALFALPS